MSRSIDALMKIGEVAKFASIAVETVRYYERERLLTPAMRTQSGYRMYDESTLKRLRFIRRAKDLGFSLEDIRQLLSIRENQNQGSSDQCRDVNVKAREKVTAIDAKIADLQMIRAGLMALLDDCPGSGPLTECPIMNALEEESDLFSGERP